MDNSAMEANRFNKVRSWLTTNKVIRQDVMKSYNFSRLRLSRWLVGSSNSRIEGWWISIPERKTLVFSPPLNVRIGWERRICSKPQACRAARLRSSIVQSSASVLKLEREASPSVIARKASSLPSIRRAWATVRLSYCPKCWGT
mgnify:CR=1 FL=1